MWFENCRCLYSSRASPNSYILPNMVEPNGYLAVDLDLADVSQQSSAISLEQS